MRNAILGTVAGLLVGSVGAVAYSHYLGDGSLLADLQSQLDSANTKLAKVQSDEKYLREQYNSETEQLNQVLNSRQGTDATTAPSASATPAAVPLSIGGVQITPDMIRGFLAMSSRGGPNGGAFRSPEQRMLLLQSRLKLTPDQTKAIKDAMDADQQARRDAFRKARETGQPPDPAALAASSTLDRTMASVLTPEQQVQYQQVQADEKTARAETTATAQVDNLVPLLQLTDDQKEKAMTALYQQQLSAPDPASLAGNPNVLGTLAQQGQTVQAALKQVLTPDQYTLYQQSEQLQQQGLTNFGGRNRGNGGNGNGGGQGQRPADAGNAPGSPTASAPTATTSTGTDTTAATGTSTTGTTTDTSSATNAPTATTNAATATPPGT
jgi:Spy/CpxP family protein refolding chaperone